MLQAKLLRTFGASADAISGSSRTYLKDKMDGKAAKQNTEKRTFSDLKTYIQIRKNPLYSLDPIYSFYRNIKTCVK